MENPVNLNNYTKCSSCGHVSTADNPAGCCSRENKTLKPWPYSYVKRLIGVAEEQDFNSAEGQRNSAIYLSFVIGLLMEEAMAVMARESNNSRYETLGSHGGINYNKMIKLYNEFSQESLQNFFKENGFSMFLSRLEALNLIRNKAASDEEFKSSPEYSEVIVYLLKNCLKAFVFLGNDIASRIKVKNEAGNASATIMIVDDEVGIREYLKILAQKQGLKATAAGSGEEAIKVFSENKPDMVLLDISLPGMSGIDVLREIRKIDALTPVFFITGMDGEGLKQQMAEMGAQGHISKPIHSKDFVSLIKSATASKVSA